MLAAALIPLMGALGGIVSKDFLAGRRDELARRKHARTIRRGPYRDFANAMEHLVALAMTEPRLPRIDAEDAAVARRVTELNGVASPLGLAAARAWLSAARNLRDAQALYEVARESGDAAVPGAWARLAAARAELVNARMAFAAMMEREIG